MAAANRILITGGSGLVGKALSQLLLAKGYQPVWLSRRADLTGEIPIYKWDIKKQHIDPAAFTGVVAIVHLAGASVGKRWTTAYKQEIFDSRILSTRLLLNTLERIPHQVKTIVSASAVGIYPHNFSKTHTEAGPFATDFLGNVCVHWEREVALMEGLGLRAVMLRTGLVLSKSGGALEPIKKTVQYFIGSPLGTGKQWMPWIHIEDLCAMYMYAIENQIHGAYNAAAPVGATNKDFTKMVGKVLNRPVIFPAVPSFVLRLVLGQMAAIILNSNKVSTNKIQAAGFKYLYPNLELALKAVLK